MMTALEQLREGREMGENTCENTWLRNGSHSLFFVCVKLSRSLLVIVGHNSGIWNIFQWI